MSEKVASLDESLQFYFASRSNQAAIDQVMGDPGKDFGWEELENFYEAWLSAQKIKVEYWRFIKMVWDVVWGRVFSEVYDNYSALIEKETYPDWMNSVWYWGCLERRFAWESDEVRKEAAFGVWEDGRLGIYFWLWDGREYLKNLELGEGWVLNMGKDEGEEDAGEFDISDQVKVVLLPLKETASEVDLSPLQEQAQKAVREVQAYLP